MNDSEHGPRMPLFSARLSRLIAGLLLPVYLASCTGWRVQNTSPEQIVSDSPSSTLRVTLANGYEVEMKNARVTEDSLYGQVKGSSVEEGVALADISQISRKKTDVGRTIGLVVGITAVLAVIAALTVPVDVFEFEGGEGFTF